jgi:hypothetical protein
VLAGSQTRKYTLNGMNYRKLFRSKYIIFVKKNFAQPKTKQEPKLSKKRIINTQANKSPNLQLNYKAGSLETHKRMVDLYGGITLLPKLALDTLTEDQFEQIRYLHCHHL